MRYHENRSRHNGVQAQPMPAAITGGYALRLTWAPGVSAQSCPSSATAVGRQSPVQQADPVPNFSRPLETPAAPMRPPQKRQSPSRWTGFGGEGWWPGALSNACISIKKCDRPMRACRAVTASVTAQKSDTKTIFEPPTWRLRERAQRRFFTHCSWEIVLGVPFKKRLLRNPILLRTSRPAPLGSPLSGISPNAFPLSSQKQLVSTIDGASETC